jgi:phospholipid transport system substrate-binding protein
MVQVLIENKDLFSKDREAYENKIKEIFDPMIDFRRVAASVMGKKYYQASSPQQRRDFVAIFRNSLLDTYSET